ncbi:MAG: exodeoxyribonuclease VII large subunit [Bacillota bacterium]
MPDELRVWTVSGITAEIRDTLYQNPELRSLWIQGEVSNLRVPASGHCYFTLKDDSAALQCVMFRSNRRSVMFDLRNGMSILALGHIDVYDRNGQYQFYVRAAEPAGTGALHLAWEQLHRRLSEEGLFDQQLKRPIPLFPRRVGVITSAKGAAFRDIVNVAHRRCPGLDILLCHSSVQGDAAPDELIAALETLNRVGGVDVIIMGRGGGSLEDLWAFNDENLVRAVRASDIPVVAGVGHETDLTLCELAADVRAPTPSAAAELVAPDVHQLRASLNRISEVMIARLRRAVRVRRQRLQVVTSRRSLSRPDDMLDRRRQDLDALMMQLCRAEANLLRDRRLRLESRAERLRALDPVRVLARGYSITADSRGRVVRDASSLKPGEEITVKVHRGELGAQVLEIRDSAER